MKYDLLVGGVTQKTLSQSDLFYSGGFLLSFFWVKKNKFADFLYTQCENEQML